MISRRQYHSLGYLFNAIIYYGRVTNIKVPAEKR